MCASRVPAMATLCGMLSQPVKLDIFPPGQFSALQAWATLLLSKTGIERAYAAIAPNLECCQAIVFMI
jgi:hypothetical protein